MPGCRSLGKGEREALPPNFCLARLSEIGATWLLPEGPEGQWARRSAGSAGGCESHYSRMRRRARGLLYGLANACVSAKLSQV